ncbi:carbohydrate ABC transporter permease [Microlunatus elymi]|nr:sugar ABC transporter permease [Microlunatus elymi]
MATHEVAAPARARRRRTVRQDMRREWSAYAFLSPGLILFTIFTLAALAFSFYLSFHSWSIIESYKPFVGMQNYKDALSDPDLGQAVINTGYFTIGSIPLTMAAGLIIALMLNQQIWGRAIFRAIFYLPVITPMVVSSIVWKFIYNGDYGILNYYLQNIGLVHHPISWLSDPNLAMPAVIIMSVWQNLGFAMVIYLAGLQSIPQSYYEAARVDGANSVQQLLRITIPLLAPTTLFLVVTSVIGSFQVFTQIYIMTNGGPVGRTNTIMYFIYQNAFQFFKMGYASALSVLLMLMLGVFTILQLRIYRPGSGGDL